MGLPVVFPHLPSSKVANPGCNWVHRLHCWLCFSLCLFDPWLIPLAEQGLWCHCSLSHHETWYLIFDPAGAAGGSSRAWQLTSLPLKFACRHIVIVEHLWFCHIISVKCAKRKLSPRSFKFADTSVWQIKYYGSFTKCAFHKNEDDRLSFDKVYLVPISNDFSLFFLARSNLIIVIYVNDVR